MAWLRLALSFASTIDRDTGAYYKNTVSALGITDTVFSSVN